MTLIALLVFLSNSSAISLILYSLENFIEVSLKLLVSFLQSAGFNLVLTALARD